MLSYFTDILDRPRQLLYLPNRWNRWATADREPIMRWTQGCITLLGDAAHPTLQYLAQGACMALEDAVTLGEAVREARGDFARAFDLYQRARIIRTARVTLMAREIGRISITLRASSAWCAMSCGRDALPTSARVALWLARRALLGRALGTRASIVNVRNQRLHKGFTIPQLALFYGLKGGAISLFLVIS